MRILFSVSEASPLYKTGGLGDVAGSLPKALKKLGHDARLVLPKYQNLELEYKKWKKVEKFETIYNHQVYTVEIWEGLLPGSDVVTYLLEQRELFSELPIPKTEIDFYAFFSQAVTTWLGEKTKGWQPQVLHLHDWHTALIPLLLRQQYIKNGINKQKDFPSHGYKTLLTIHNLSYQGVSPLKIVKKLNLDPHKCQVLSWDMENGDIDVLMEGIIHADLINTVSPTYAKEILTPKYGATLDPVLNGMQGKIFGILNGLDLKKWNPQTDQILTQTYNVENWFSGKRANKISVQKETGLNINAETILIGFVGRIESNQKGVQLIINAAQAGKLTGMPMSAGDKNNQEVQFVLLGTGDPELEKQLKDISNHNQNFATVLKYDGKLAHKIYAGCDFMLVPSKFEPCGLIQMISMRYGTIPIVRQTGGLTDTVFEGETGYLFSDYNSESMINALTKALSENKDYHHREQMVMNCMNQDFSWNKSAKEYVKLYERLVISNLK